MSIGFDDNGRDYVIVSVGAASSEITGRGWQTLFHFILVVNIPRSSTLHGLKNYFLNQVTTPNQLVEYEEKNYQLGMTEFH